MKTAKKPGTPSPAGRKAVLPFPVRRSCRQIRRKAAARPAAKTGLLSLLLLLFLVFLSGCAVDTRAKPSELERMLAAALSGEDALGRAASQELALRIEKSGAEETPVDYDELLLLARFLTAAGGEGWASEELCLCTGEVLLNRVASPEFPDTLAAVLSERGMFPASLTPAGLAGLRPSRACAEAALELLLGRRLLSPLVVYRGDRLYGGGIYATFCDRRQRFTYFCLTEHPELYE